MRSKGVTILVAIGFILMGFLVTNSMAFETLVEEEVVNVGGTEMQVVKTAANFIILFDSSSSMDKKYKNTEMRKVNAEKKMVREMNDTLPELNYMAGLYTFTGGKGDTFLNPYYPMKRYNKAEFAAAIDKLPDVGKGPTYLQDAMRELGDVLDRLREGSDTPDSLMVSLEDHILDLQFTPLWDPSTESSAGGILLIYDLTPQKRVEGKLRKKRPYRRT